jgi:DNA-binding response OmpR family regulator
MKTMKSALFIGACAQDHRLFREICSQQDWTLFSATTFPAGVAILERRNVPVIILERDLPLGTWHDALAFLQHTEEPPLVIVVSRTADRRLWAEVLNLGGFDVLATPFRYQKVAWVLESAWRMLTHRSCSGTHKGVREACTYWTSEMPPHS